MRHLHREVPRAFFNRCGVPVVAPAADPVSEGSRFVNVSLLQYIVHALRCPYRVVWCAEAMFLLLLCVRPGACRPSHPVGYEEIVYSHHLVDDT